MEYRLKNTYFVADNIVSSLGLTTSENMEAIVNIQSGIRFYDDGMVADAPILAGRICCEQLDIFVQRNELESLPRLEQIAIFSIQNVLEQNPIDVTKCRLILSTTKGNVDLLHQATDNIKNQVFLQSTARCLKDYFRIEKNPIVISNACISGLSALIVADRILQTGDCENILVVGIDILSHFITSGFCSFKSLSDSICRPYDESRDGLNLGEACGTILLSSIKTDNAAIFLGGAITNDANHISGPSKSGDGLFYAIKEAMDEANIAAHDIDIINLHGTATIYNDDMESKALKLAELTDVPTNSLKPYFGHTLGASGIIETIACLYQLRNNCIFGVNTYKESGTTYPLNVSNQHREPERINICLKTASGFGGCNAAIVISTENKDRKIISAIKTVEIYRCVIEKNTIRLNDEIKFSSESTEYDIFIREAYKALDDSYPKFHKMDNLSKLGYITAEHLLKDLEFAPTEAGIILANRSSSLDTDIRFQQIIDKDGDSSASPAVFVYTLPNIVAGEICIRHKIQGENTFFIEDKFCETDLLKYAETVMAHTNLKYCIYGWCEYIDNKYKSDFKLIEKI